MRLAAVTQRGPGKAKSDDRILINGRILSEEALFADDIPITRIAVADGVGGNPGGDLAAEFICAALRECPVTEAALTEINRALLAYAGTQPGCGQMAAAVSGVDLAENRIFHVGNTRVCALRHGYLRQLTRDHTAQGLFGAEEAGNAPKNEIFCCFGGGNAQLFRPELGDYAGQKLLLLTSDGIHDHISAEETEQIMRLMPDLRACADALLRQALQNGSHDDCSLAIVQTE